MAHAPARKPELVIPEPPPGVTYRPLYEWVLLERIHIKRSGTLADNIDAPDGGIWRADLAREKRERTLGQAVYARVLSVGRGRILIDGSQRPVNPAIAPGQLVVTWALSGRGITGAGDEDRFVVVEDDVLAIIEDPKAVTV